MLDGGWSWLGLGVGFCDYAIMDDFVNPLEGGGGSAEEECVESMLLPLPKAFVIALTEVGRFRHMRLYGPQCGVHRASSKSSRQK